MTVDFHHGRRLGPGVYDHEGDIHIDAEEICAHFGVACNDENFRTIVEGSADALADFGISAAALFVEER